MFSFLREKISSAYQSFTKKLHRLFSRHSEKNDQFFSELETILLEADTGIQTVKKIIAALKEQLPSGELKPEVIKETLKKILLKLLPENSSHQIPEVLLLVGINGSGKTTTLGKICDFLQKQNKKILLVAGDTFRAAAQEQLEHFASELNIEIFLGKENQDPASLVFDACKKFKEEHFDHILIDTAGRLQTKVNLMRELEKIKSIISKKLPDTQTETWITIDSMLGQNSVNQAEIFDQATSISGVILTKCDGTGKGGIIFSIYEKLKLPVRYITYGEKLSDIAPFNQENYIDQLLSE